MSNIGQTILTDRQTYKQRESGIELLKIIAIILIVISHVVQTLGSTKSLYIKHPIDLATATNDINTFVVILMRHFGAWGNTIFFISSAWFLLKSNSYKKKKCFQMVIEVWFISVLILFTTYYLRHGDMPIKLIIKSFMPTLFANNWYITNYLLFYPLHPMLNYVIRKMTKLQLFRMTTFMFVLYFCLELLPGIGFMGSSLILWVVIYFIIAFLQMYMSKFLENVTYDVILLVLGCVGNVAIIYLTNILGLRFEFFNGRILYWNVNNNPFLLISSIALFSLFRKIKIRNRTINYISSLSLLVYIIHENIIIRTYYRPQLWNYVYLHYGYERIVFWVIALSIIVLAISLIASIFYDKTIRRLILKLSDNLYDRICNMYLRIENCTLNQIKGFE